MQYLSLYNRHRIDFKKTFVLNRMTANQPLQPECTPVSNMSLRLFSPLWQYIARASSDMQRDQMRYCIDHIFLLLQEDGKPTITTYVHFSCQSFKHEFQIILDKQQ